MKTRMLLSALVLLTAVAVIRADDEPKWQSLFNGKNLDGWTPKVTGHELNDNYANTFRVEDGVIKVGYDKYRDFGGKFGHLFYKTPFQAYRLRLNYKVLDPALPDTPAWAKRRMRA